MFQTLNRLEANKIANKVSEDTERLDKTKKMMDKIKKAIEDDSSKGRFFTELTYDAETLYSNEIIKFLKGKGYTVHTDYDANLINISWR